jgi:hypothetical protein
LHQHQQSEAFLRVNASRKMFFRLVLNFRSSFFSEKIQAEAKQTIKEKLIMRGFVLCIFGPMPEQGDGAVLRLIIIIFLCCRLIGTDK